MEEAYAGTSTHIGAHGFTEHILYRAVCEYLWPYLEPGFLGGKVAALGMWDICI